MKYLISQGVKIKMVHLFSVTVVLLWKQNLFIITSFLEIKYVTERMENRYGVKTFSSIYF